MTTTDEAKMWLGDEAIAMIRDSNVTLRASFFDSGGLRVRRMEGGPLEVVAAAVKFILLHGVDPEGCGEAATAGGIEFSVVDAGHSATHRRT